MLAIQLATLQGQAVQECLTTQCHQGLSSQNAINPDFAQCELVIISMTFQNNMGISVTTNVTTKRHNFYFSFFSIKY